MLHHFHSSHRIISFLWIKYIYIFSRLIPNKDTQHLILVPFLFPFRALRETEPYPTTRVEVLYHMNNPTPKLLFIPLLKDLLYYHKNSILIFYSFCIMPVTSMYMYIVCRYCNLNIFY